MTDELNTKLAVLQAELKNESKLNEDRENRIVRRLDKTDATIRYGFATIIGLISKAGFDFFSRGGN